MEKMNECRDDGPKMDTTEFWKAWRKTCAFRTCREENALAVHNQRCVSGRDGLTIEERVDPALFEQIVRQACYVADRTDVAMAGLIRFPRMAAALKRFRKDEDDETSAQAVEREIKRNEVECQESVVSLDTDAGSRIARDNDRVRTDGSGYEECETRDDRADAIPQGGGRIRPARPKGQMVSEYRDYLAQWAKHEPNAIRAFELVEIYLYGHQRDGAGVLITDARKIKDYLFEAIASRPGGISVNLWGYLLKGKANGNQRSVLWNAARDSFRNPLLPQKSEESRKEDDIPGPDDGRSTQVSRELEETVLDYWQGCWASEYSEADRLSVCWAVFGLNVEDPRLRDIADLKKSAFYNHRKRAFEGLFRRLKELDYQHEDISAFLAERAESVLKKVICFSSDERYMNLIPRA